MCCLDLEGAMTFHMSTVTVIVEIAGRERSFLLEVTLLRVKKLSKQMIAAQWDWKKVARFSGTVCTDGSIWFLVG